MSAADDGIDLLDRDVVRGVARDRAPSRLASREGSLLVDLAALHARRIVLHPVVLIGLAWSVLSLGIGLPDTPYERYSTMTGILAFFLGPLSFFAANLVASAERRSGADEWTPALPMSPARRTTALLLACLAPAGVTLALDLTLFAIVGQPDPVLHLQWAHVASVPATVLGGAVLGVAVARLLPWPGAALLVMVSLVATNLWVGNRHPYLGFYVDFAEWTSSDAVPALEPGSGTWHLGFLVSLTGLAACGALLRDARRPWLPFLGGAACGVLVLVAGVAQLP